MGEIGNHNRVLG